MSVPPVRFEEVAFNYGFIPADPYTSRSYCRVYRLFLKRLEEESSVVLVRGNERVIQLKDITGPREDREKVTIFSQDIIDFYPFNLRNKTVGFLIQAARRSKTGFWFLVFQREGQYLAFCDFLHWLIYGRVPRSRRPMSPSRDPLALRSYYNSPSRRPSKRRSSSCPAYRSLSQLDEDPLVLPEDVPLSLLVEEEEQSLELPEEELSLSLSSEENEVELLSDDEESEDEDFEERFCAVFLQRKIRYMYQR
ncbi:unnamed protein product [Mesocestoides corti]|uniref:DUF5737 domain-containing protein n=1 Tax=Mesocestoides corti TaxID=53468 RepID=A0A0R3UFR7_MESCO|nr:unnamed protein product [Mesocestoides corti]